MSHVATVQIEVKDLDVLEAAAKRVGLELVRGQQTYRWWGRSVGDYPLPEGMTVDDLGKCDHALRIPETAVFPQFEGQEKPYEIGVRRQADGSYQLAWDFIDDRLSGLVGGPMAPKLKQAYATEAAKRKALSSGWSVTETVKADGTIQLNCRK